MTSAPASTSPSTSTKPASPTASPDTGETIEEAARAVRYDFFTSLIASGHADSVLTAHTLDDQAETVLMKLLRGAWTEGLSGIHPVVIVQIHRNQNAPAKSSAPSSNIRRAEIESYLNQLNQPWREDSTNSDDAFTRNRIRHHSCPCSAPKTLTLDQTLSQPRRTRPRRRVPLADRTQPASSPNSCSPANPSAEAAAPSAPPPAQSAIAIELDRLRALDPALRRRVLRAAARQLGARLSFDETSRLLALCGFLLHPHRPARNRSHPPALQPASAPSAPPASSASPAAR